MVRCRSFNDCFAWRVVDHSDRGGVVVAGQMAIACASGGSQVDCSVLLVRNSRHDVLLTAPFNMPLSNVIALL